jgi:hypothetical protein
VLVKITATKLQNNGFEAFFVEHLSPDLDYEYEANKALDAEGKLKKGAKLTLKLQDLDRGHSEDEGFGENSFSSVVRKALQVGMKVVPLELSDEAYSSNKSADASRMLELNANALKIISNESANFLAENGRPLKWVGFVGSGHLHTYCDVPGICDVFPNVVSLLVCEVAQGQEGFQIFHAPTGIFLPNKNSASSVDEDLKSTGEQRKPDLKVLAALFASRESDLSFDAISRLANSAVENKSVSSDLLKNDFLKEGQKDSAATEAKAGLFSDSEAKSILPAPPTNSLKRKKNNGSEVFSPVKKIGSNLFYSEQLTNK